MPEAIETPPAAPSAPQNLTPTPTSEIHVTPGQVVDKGPAPAPPKPGSARDRMFQDLRKKAGVTENDPEKKSAVTTKTPTKEGVSPETKPETTTDTEVETTTKIPETTTTTSEDKKKVSPWKLVEQYKSRVAELEKSVADAKTTGLAETEKKALSDKLTQTESKLKEYEEEIRFTNYSKSQEFKEKYQQPYEEAWKKWMGELGELTVTASDGTDRPISVNDILQLVNTPLQKAREQANQIFGDFADDVMAARKEIRSLFDSQNKALEDARKNGSERDQKRAQEMQAQQDTIRKQATELWGKINKEVVENEQYGHYFKPIEGDTEGNDRLKKGYELADKAFSVNSFDPRLTPEQRAEIVRIHAAVRNRCASFGRLTFQNQKLQGEMKALQDELAKFKGAQPGAGEGVKTDQTQPHYSSAKESMFAELRKRAH